MSERDPVNTIAKDTEASAMPHASAAAASVNMGGVIVIVVAAISMAFTAVTAFVSGSVYVLWQEQAEHVRNVDTYMSLNYAHELQVQAIVEAHGVDLSKAGQIPKPPK